MADTKVTALDENTTVLGTDILYLVDDPGGSPASQKATVTSVQNVMWSIIQASQLANEVMNFPANVGIDVDLVAGNLWWDSVATPSTAATMVDVAGEAGITETWEYALKCVADGNGDGLYQRYTYAAQPRIKSGRALSAIAAVWVGTAGRTVTMKLITSASTEVSATATAQTWTIIKAENLTLDGTYVDLQFTVDGADTFYVVPLGVNIGSKAVPLPPRGLIVIDKATEVVSNVDPGGSPAGYIDVDVTAATSALATMVELWMYYKNATITNSVLAVRRNGSAATGSVIQVMYTISTAIAQTGRALCCLDDGQIFEYGTTAEATDTETLYIVVDRYWEWA